MAAIALQGTGFNFFLVDEPDGQDKRYEKGSESPSILVGKRVSGRV